MQNQLIKYFILTVLVAIFSSSSGLQAQEEETKDVDLDETEEIEDNEVSASFKMKMEFGDDDHHDKKNKRSKVGYGGGGPNFIYLDQNFDELNTFFTRNGFDEISPENAIIFGGYGMGNMGKGLFIGGGGGGIEVHQQIAVLDSSGTSTGQRSIRYLIGYGGLKLTKKYAIYSDDLILDLDMLIGGGGMEVHLSQTDGQFSWEDTIDENEHYSMRLLKGFLVVHPSIGIMYRVTKWMGVRASAGYFGTYSPSDKWTDMEFNYDVEGDGPGLPNGMTYALDVWFGY